MSAGGQLSGCWGCVKWFFIVFNFLFWAVGVAALAIGIWAAVSKSFTTEVLDVLTKMQLDKADMDKIVDPDMVKNAAILIIVAGGIVMLIGFFGCCGALRENRFLLGLFFIMLFIILGLIIAGAVMVLGFPDIIKKEFTPIVEKFVEEWSKNPTANGTIDLIQEQLKCCGVTGPDTYNATKPASCGSYTIGCAAAFEKNIEATMKDNPWILGGIGLGVLGLLVVGMGLSCSLCIKIGKEED